MNPGTRELSAQIDPSTSDKPRQEECHLEKPRWRENVDDYIQAVMDYVAWERVKPTPRSRASLYKWWATHKKDYSAEGWTWPENKVEIHNARDEYSQRMSAAHRERVLAVQQGRYDPQLLNTRYNKFLQEAVVNGNLTQEQYERVKSRRKRQWQVKQVNTKTRAQLDAVENGKEGPVDNQAQGTDQESRRAMAFSSSVEHHKTPETIAGGALAPQIAHGAVISTHATGTPISAPPSPTVSTHENHFLDSYDWPRGFERSPSPQRSICKRNMVTGGRIGWRSYLLRRMNAAWYSGAPSNGRYSHF